MITEDVLEMRAEVAAQRRSAASLRGRDDDQNFTFWESGWALIVVLLFALVAAALAQFF